MQAKIKTRDARIIKLIADVDNYKVLLEQAQQKIVQVENKFKKITEVTDKLQVSWCVCVCVV